MARSLEGLHIGTIYHIIISATDERGLVSLHPANVTVSIVDHDASSEGPVFTQRDYHFIVDENASVSTHIGNVSALSRG